MASTTGLRCPAAAPATLRPGGCSRATLVLPQLLRSCPCTRRRLERRQGGVVVEARSNRSLGGGGGSGGQVGRPSFGPSHLDRVLAAIPYILPFFDAVMYGRYLFHMFPVLRAAMQPLFPAIAAYHSVPFASFAAFFGVYLGIVNNKSMSRFVRFNGMQAALLDILLVLPRLLESVVSPPTAGLGAKIYIYSQSFIWIFICMWVAFGMVTSLLGQYGRIPFVAEAADQQVR